MTFNPQALTDVRLYWATCDMTGFSNEVEVDAALTELPKTTYASGGWAERTGGLFDGQAMASGFFQATDLSMPDDTLWANFGSALVPLTAVPTSGAVNSLAYLTRVLETEYKPGGQVGQLLAWGATAKTDKPWIRGTVMHPQGTARTASGNGTGIQVGAVSAAQRMYANLHVLSVSGTTPSLTVLVQSSVDNTFAAPTTRITFNASTALDAQHSSALGAITDTWWRVTWTITGTTPSFLFAVSAGVGPR